MTNNRDMDSTLESRIQYPRGRGRGGGGGGGRNRGGGHGNHHSSRSGGGISRDIGRDIRDDFEAESPTTGEKGLFARVTMPVVKNQEQRELEALIEGQGNERKRRLSEHEAGWGREDKRHQRYSPTHRDNHRVRHPPITFYDSYKPPSYSSPPPYYRPHFPPSHPLTPPRDRHVEYAHNRSSSSYQNNQGYSKPLRGTEKGDCYRPPPPVSPIERRRSISPPPRHNRPQPQRKQSNQQLRRGSLQQVELFPDRPIATTPVTPTERKAFGEKSGAEKALLEKEKAVTETDRRGSGGIVAQSGTPTTTASTLKTVTLRGDTSTIAITTTPSKTITTTVSKDQTTTAFGPEISRSKTTTTVPMTTSAVPGISRAEKKTTTANVEMCLDGSGTDNRAATIQTNEPAFRVPPTPQQSKGESLPSRATAPISVPVKVATKPAQTPNAQPATKKATSPQKPAQCTSQAPTAKAPPTRRPVTARPIAEIAERAPRASSPIIKSEYPIKLEIKTETEPDLLSSPGPSNAILPTGIPVAGSTPKPSSTATPTMNDPTRPVDKLFNFLSGETSKANTRSPAESNTTGTPPAPTGLPPPRRITKPRPTPTQSRPASPSAGPKVDKAPVDEGTDPMDTDMFPLTTTLPQTFPKVEERFIRRITGLQTENRGLREQIDTLREDYDQLAQESVHYQQLYHQSQAQIKENEAKVKAQNEEAKLRELLLEKEAQIRKMEAENKALSSRLKEEREISRLVRESLSKSEEERKAERKRKRVWEADVKLLKEIVERNEKGEYVEIQMDTSP